VNTKHFDTPFELKSLNETGAFEGYGSVFGVKDSYNEIVAPGAFADSLLSHRTAGTMPALLWQHRSGEPIGVFTAMREDDIGLHVTGQLAMKTSRGAEAYELLKMKAITGMSIGFVPRTDTYDSKSGVRTLTAVDLWETSLVTFPANEAARVQGVKSIESIATLRDAERLLREQGMSRSEAVAFVARVKSLGQSDSDEGDMSAVIAALKNNHTILGVKHE